MARERLAVYTASFFDANLPSTAGVAETIDFNLPLGQGARVLWAELVAFSVLGTSNGKAMAAISLDPSEALPASFQAIIDNLDVLITWSFNHSFSTNGATIIKDTQRVDVSHLDMLIARNLSVVGLNQAGADILTWGVKVGFRLVDLSDAEMADVLARQR